MRFDLISIFPRYFEALDLSLLGKAQDSGLLTIEVRDLREYATGRHLSVDDTPAGGGAGMVMRPDVWGRAIDKAIAAPLADSAGADRRVLAIPTPSGVPLTQQQVEDLVGADQIIVACGRYEGPDSRVGEHYRSAGVEVLEFSLGDYVLNGGEIAALVLVEAVGRLLDGVIGNPESLVEESHSTHSSVGNSIGGLLEYPAFTQPRQWRGLDTPAVLLSGDHGRIARWRRDRSLERTARRRPDLIARLVPELLDWQDRLVLAMEGYLVSPRPQKVALREACPEDISALAALAALTFPDACPDYITDQDKTDFIRENLSEAAFRGYMEDPDYLVLVAEVRSLEGRGPIDSECGELAAYTLVGRHAPEKMGRAPKGSAYLSKCYTDPAYRGSGVTAALVTRTMELTEDRWTPPAMALATHIGNKRAARFYRQCGFRKAGRRIFMVGGAENIDDVFVADFVGQKSAAENSAVTNSGVTNSTGGEGR